MPAQNCSELRLPRSVDTRSLSISEAPARQHSVRQTFLQLVELGSHDLFTNPFIPFGWSWCLVRDNMCSSTVFDHRSTCRVRGSKRCVGDRKSRHEFGHWHAFKVTARASTNSVTGAAWVTTGAGARCSLTGAVTGFHTMFSCHVWVDAQTFPERDERSCGMFWATFTIAS